MKGVMHVDKHLTEKKERIREFLKKKKSGLREMGEKFDKNSNLTELFF